MREIHVALGDIDKTTWWSVHRCIPALQEETLVDEDRFERLEKLIIKRNKSMLPVTSWRSNGWCLGCLGSFYRDGPTKRRNRKEKSFRQGAPDGDSSVPSLHFASIFSFSPWLPVTSRDFPWLPSEQVRSEDEGWRSSVIWTKRGQRELGGRIHDGKRLRHPDALAELGPKNGHRNHRN